MGDDDACPPFLDQTAVPANSKMGITIRTMQTKMSFKLFGQFCRHVNAIFQIDYRADIWRTSKIYTDEKKGIL